MTAPTPDTLARLRREYHAIRQGAVMSPEWEALLDGVAQARAEGAAEMRERCAQYHDEQALWIERGEAYGGRRAARQHREDAAAIRALSLPAAPTTLSPDLRERVREVLGRMIDYLEFFEGGAKAYSSDQHLATLRSDVEEARALLAELDSEGGQSNG